MLTRADEPEAAERLDGQVALVTGAGRGIGRAIALALSHAGASVAVCSRSADQVSRVAREIAFENESVLALRCDVLRRDEVDDMVGRVERAFGAVDLLVNNAGQFGPVGSIAELDPDAWWHAMEVNLRGPLYCTRAVLPDMLHRGRGRILNVSSASGLTAVPGLSAYSVSKAALFRLTENLAAETRAGGVSVFTIVPGLVRTAMTESALSCGDAAIEQWFKGAFARQANISAERAANLAVYLATGAADVLSGRYFFATDDVREMVCRAKDIQEQDLYVMRGRP